MNEFSQNEAWYVIFLKFAPFYGVENGAVQNHVGGFGNSYSSDEGWKNGSKFYTASSSLTFCDGFCNNNKEKSVFYWFSNRPKLESNNFSHLSSVWSYEYV